jgi:hypothetical protein
MQSPRPLLRWTCLSFGAAAFCGGVVLGAFTALGIVACAWGPQVVDSALGNPPDRTHPAFWAWLLIMPAAMLLTGAGTLVCVTGPLLRLGGVTLRGGDRQFVRAYGRWLLAITRDRAGGGNPPTARPAGQAG